MVDVSGLRLNAQDFIKQYGESVRFRYFSVSGGSAGYDDNVTLTTSGTDTWVSGLAQPFDLRRGAQEAILSQQGKVFHADLKLYVDGTVVTSGTFRVGIGSANPPTSEYAVVDPGVIYSPSVNGGITYKKLIMRRLATGSLVGE